MDFSEGFTVPNPSSKSRQDQLGDSSFRHPHMVKALALCNNGPLVAAEEYGELLL